MTEHHTPTIERRCDVAVIGGSAAGLAAALQLGRQRRSVIVIDGGDPRNATAQHMHSYLGHEGLPPADFAAIGRDEVRAYGVEVIPGRVTEVTAAQGSHDGLSHRFVLSLTGGSTTIRARSVLLATGLTDHLPTVDGLREHWGRSVIHCPFCHGFEARDSRIAAIITSPLALHPALLLHRLSASFTLILHEGVEADAPELDAFRAGGATVVSAPAQRIRTGDTGAIEAVETVDGQVVAADVVMVAPRVSANADAVASVGVAPVEHPMGVGTVIETDPTGETSVPGVYAAGNITDPTHQMLQAAADGSRVGAMIAMALANDDRQSGIGSAPNEADWDARYGGDPIWSGNPNGALVAEADGLAPGRVLDVGAGEGGDAIWLAQHGWAVVANDVSSLALDRIETAAHERNLDVSGVHADANAPSPFEPEAFDLVTAHYASIPRTPDDRAVENMIEAVAPGGTLLVVGHDLEPMRQPIDRRQHSRAFDPDAYVGVDHVASALADRPGWQVEVHELRPRPGGAASHHADDVVLRARRTAGT